MLVLLAKCTTFYKLIKCIKRCCIRCASHKSVDRTGFVSFATIYRLVWGGKNQNTGMSWLTGRSITSIRSVGWISLRMVVMPQLRSLISLNVQEWFHLLISIKRTSDSFGRLLVMMRRMKLTPTGMCFLLDVLVRWRN